ncbi:MAG: NarK/NasA family nitrate transporter [Thermoleophilia bacterium]|nr:NarK/NasA family nitrate transporter [Thermoleophilia bacterium]
MANATEKASSSGTWLEDWDPENDEFWERRGKSIANKTLIITTANLTVAFAVWFVVSALVVTLKKNGIYTFSDNQWYWLVAMPGLAGGTLRLVHMFLTPKYGTRHVVTISSALLLIPLIGWYFAVQNPDTPYGVLLLLAFLAGLGGGNFSSFMPSTSLFFPKKRIGTALAVQAGIGNFGVSLVQFITPWVIGFSLLGSAQATATGGSFWLQNAVLFWIPFVVVFTIWAWFGLRSVPVRANVREQFDIFRERHTWTMTSLYVMTFGSFAGFAATFPILIETRFGGFDNPPVPLEYAFLGPLVGSVARVVAGPISDKFGGARVTQVSGIGLLVCTLFASRYVAPDSIDDFTPFLWGMLGIFLFAGIGNASTFKQIPMIFPQRQSAGVIGWTAAIAAYGPFVFGVLIGAVSASTGSPRAFFLGLAVFYAINIVLNWYSFARRGAKAPC